MNLNNNTSSTQNTLSPGNSGIVSENVQAPNKILSTPTKNVYSTADTKQKVELEIDSHCLEILKKIPAMHRHTIVNAAIINFSKTNFFNSFLQGEFVDVQEPTNVTNVTNSLTNTTSTTNALPPKAKVSVNF